MKDVTWISVDKQEPPIGVLCWIRGPQMSPMKATRRKVKEFDPCWIPEHGVPQYQEAVTEWAPVEK